MTPARLTVSRPRDVRYTAAGKALTALAVVLLVAAVVVPALMFRHQQRQAADHRAFLASGIVTDAELVRRWKTSGEKNREMVAYRYVAEGRVYDAQAKVRSSLLRGLGPGNSLKVRYLPSDARRVMVDGTFERDLPLVVPYIVGAGLLLVGLGAMQAVRLQVRLLAEGRAATGIVTGTKKHSSSHGGSHQSVSYEFRLLNGAKATGRTDVGSKAPPVGSTVDVIYDPDRPEKSRLYPLSLVRPA